MRSVRRSGLIGLLALACSAHLARAQHGLVPTPGACELPARYKTEPGFRNAQSGDKRIELLPFRAILFFDTKDPRHRDAENNLTLLKFLLDNFNAQARDDFRKGFTYEPTGFAVTPPPRVLSGAKATKAALNQEIDNLAREVKVLAGRPGSGGAIQEHVVFFWCESEGERDALGRRQLMIYDQERAARGDPNPYDRYDREELKKRLELWDGPERRTRLVVFITDSCSTVDPTATLPAERLSPPRIWRSLYFGHQQTMDISSSQMNEKAFAAGGVSFFARAFLRTFDGGFKDTLDANKDCFIEWEGEYLRQLPDKIDEVYREYLGRYFDLDNPKLTTTRAFDDLGDHQKELKDQLVDLAKRFRGHRLQFQPSKAGSVSINPGT
jgi:hypothetical protein